MLANVQLAKFNTKIYLQELQRKQRARRTPNRSTTYLSLSETKVRYRMTLSRNLIQYPKFTSISPFQLSKNRPIFNRTIILHNHNPLLRLSQKIQIDHTAVVANITNVEITATIIKVTIIKAIATTSIIQPVLVK